jgi:CheY-like chemotaxis protein
MLLDLNMPRINGFELLEWIRQDPKCRRLVVHILTASARVAEMERAYNLGANSYLVKPSGMKELVELASTLHRWHRLTMLPRCAEDSPRVVSQV